MNRRPARRPQSGDRAAEAQDPAGPGPAQRLPAAGGNAALARQPSAHPELATVLGNHAFVRLLQRQPPTTDAPAEAPVEPRFKATEFGHFLVYPDAEAKRLGAAAYHQMAPGHHGPTDAFRVTESTFARIELAMAAVKAGSGWLKIEGPAEFKAKVMPDLAWLLTSTVGAELFEAMAKSGRKCAIVEATDGNATAYDPDADSWEKDDGTPGKGCDTKVEYDPGTWNPYGGTEEWMMRPPAIGLAHEMVHAWTGMTGTRAKGNVKVGKSTERRRELQATGLGDWEKAKLSENRFRAAFGLPLRPRYTT